MPGPERISIVTPDRTSPTTETRLAEAEEMIDAISRGEVDAVVVNGPSGPRVYTLEGADHPYRVLVEQMQEATVTLDHDGLILYANGRFAELIGAPPLPSVIGSRLEQFLPPVDFHVFTGMVEAATVNGHSSGELHLLAAGAMLVPVRISVASLEVAGMQNWCIVAGDLREQRRNEAIVKEEQLSRRIFEQAGEAIVVIDPRGIIIRRSESANSLAGSPVLMCSFDEVFPLVVSGRALKTEQILLAARAGEHMRGVDAEMLGNQMNSAVLVSVGPVWNGNELLGCVITLTNITERKRSEQALARQAEELAQANGDLRQFAYSASHDLREPLRQIALFTELLRKKNQDVLDDESGRYIQYTVDAAHRMERLLKDLLAYTQAAEAPQGAMAPADANDIVRKTLAVFEIQIGECRAHISCGSLPVVEVDEVHLTQIFQNLISNALKYRGEAPPQIQISATRAEGMWRFSIADNGIGIDPDYQRQIFGLFQRLHGDGKYAGSGIGLAICQKIVQRYGGRIWVESEPGRGSRFLFTLPGQA